MIPELEFQQTALHRKVRHTWEGVEQLAGQLRMEMRARKAKIFQIRTASELQWVTDIEQKLVVTSEGGAI